MILASCSPGSSGNSSESNVLGDQATAEALGASDIQATSSQMKDGSKNWQVVMTWKKSPTAPSDIVYNIERSQVTNTVVKKTFIKDYEDIKDSPYTITDLPPESTQYFTISATGTFNGITKTISSQEYSIKIPLDAYTKKPGSFVLTGDYTDRTATLNWTEPKDDEASFYIIQSGFSSGSYPTEVKKMPDAVSRTYKVKNLPLDKKIYFMVIAVNSVGSTKATEEFEVTTVNYLNITATASPGDAKVALSWTPTWTGVNSTNGFDIYRSSSSATANDFEKINSSTLAATENAYTDNSVSNGSTYFYKVIAHTSSPQGDATSTVVKATPLSTPVITSTVAGDSQVTINWSASTGASGYTLEYGTSAGVYPATVNLSNLNSLSYTLTGLTNGTLYYFMIIATNDTGSVNASHEETATPSNQIQSNWIGSKQISSVHHALRTTTGIGFVHDTQGNIYVAGYTNADLDGNTLMGNQDLFLTKYNSTGTKQWTKQLGSTGATLTTHGVTIDSSSNIYIVGNAEGSGFDSHTQTGGIDIFVAKFNSSGDKVWTRQLGSTGLNMYNQPHSTNGLGITSDGTDIYITGSSDGDLNGESASGNGDHVVIKYSNAGDVVWTRFLNTTNGSGATGEAIAYDGAGSIYAVGSTNGILPNASRVSTGDTYIVKYDTSGNITAITQYGSSVDYWSYTVPWSVSYDNVSNSIFITGYTSGNLDGPLTGSYDVFTAKFDSSLSLQWVRQMGVNSIYTIGYGITNDSAGNAYITGYTAGLDGNQAIGYQDMFITKYSGSGTKQWTKELGVSNVGTFGNGIMSDSSDSIYAVGSTSGAFDSNTLMGYQDMVIIKYDSSDTKQWSHQLGGGLDTPTDTKVFGIASDNSENVYVSGHTQGSIDSSPSFGEQELFVIKYDNTGTKVWSRQFGAQDATITTSGMVIDNSGNIYVTGCTTSSLVDGLSLDVSSDFFLIKYDSSGNQQWITEFGSTYFGSTSEPARSMCTGGITTDQSGNIYLTGYTNRRLESSLSQTGSLDFFVVKYDNQGVKQWSRQMGASSKQTKGLSITSDSSSNVYITGYTTGGIDGNTRTGTEDLFITKYDSSGTKQWTHQLGVSSKKTEGFGITSDSSANVYVTGFTEGALDLSTLTGTRDLFVTKYDSSGTKQWTHLLGSTAASTQGLGITSDTSNIYVTGFTTGALDNNSLTGIQDLFVAKYDFGGNYAWSRQMGGANSFVTATSITKSASGGVYISEFSDGDFDGLPLSNATFIDAFITKYDANGNKL